jgi:hypothetical protein
MPLATTTLVAMLVTALLGVGVCIAGTAAAESERRSPRGARLFARVQPRKRRANPDSPTLDARLFECRALVAASRALVR